METADKPKRKSKKPGKPARPEHVSLREKVAAASRKRGIDYEKSVAVGMQPRRAMIIDHFINVVAPKLGIDPHTYDRNNLTLEQRQAIFLEMYREFGNWRPGCRFAGITREQVRGWKLDEDFAKRMEDAYNDCIDGAELEAWRRAVEGTTTTKQTHVEKDSADKGLTVEDSTTVTHEYSDNLLVTILKANRPKYNTTKTEVSGPDGGPIQVARVERVIVDPQSGGQS